MTSRRNPSRKSEFKGEENEVRIMTLNPGHFHAALVQKNMLDQVDPKAYVFAPEGPDLDLHLDRIEGFNSRKENPSNWQTEVYSGEDYLERMLETQPGNVMVTAGNNGLKTEYIKKAVDNGINVLSDKPMVIDKAGWKLLVSAFESAEENGVLLYDIMTERNEITTMIQRLFSQNSELFGELKKGSSESPAIFKESIHHLYKIVAGKPLQRPAWYFDVGQQGEGVVDVTTHLVDLSMWGLFPDEVFDYRKDVKVLDGDRWPTVITREQFERITGFSEFPDYLKDQLDGDELPYYSNGEIHYTLKGHHAKASVQWDYEAPEGGGDSHFSVFKGTKSNLLIRQGVEQNYKATLYVEPAGEADPDSVKKALQKAVADLEDDKPGIEIIGTDKGWQLDIPDKYYLGHEAHFGKVAQDYFGFLVNGKLPEWEVPNMITKYYITSQARELALKKE